jgi:hypothetical protein
MLVVVVVGMVVAGKMGFCICLLDLFVGLFVDDTYLMHVFFWLYLMGCCVCLRLRVDVC